MGIFIFVAMSILWALAFYGFALVMDEKSRIWGIVILVLTSVAVLVLEQLSHWSYEALALSGLLSLALFGGIVYIIYHVYERFCKKP